MGEKPYKIQDSISGRRKSKLAKYRDMVIGRSGWWPLVRYELIVLLVSRIPGALGILLRGILYRRILGHVGRGVVFGAGITFRHPHKIRIGDGVVIDDDVLLDAKGESNEGISIGRDAFIGRHSILSCKDGDILLGERANVGFHCEVFSASRVEVGDDCLLAAYSYLVGGGNYGLDRRDIPINRQLRPEGRGGIRLVRDVWIGAHAVVLDGVVVGEGGVVAAGAVAVSEVPSWSIVAGLPARVVKERSGTVTHDG